MENLKEKVYNYPTRYREGFTDSEIKTLLKDYPDINKDRFDDALKGITCLVLENNVITYHCDIYYALLCGIENRKLFSWEWD